MIVTFGDKNTQKIWEGERIRGVSVELQELTRRKLRMLNNSVDIKDLTIPPSNRLEKLKGKLSDYYSIRINDQWRVVFQWINGNAYNVEFIDYHWYEKAQEYTSRRGAVGGVLTSAGGQRLPPIERDIHTPNTGFRNHQRQEAHNCGYCTKTLQVFR